MEGPRILDQERRGIGLAAYPAIFQFTHSPSSLQLCCRFLRRHNEVFIFRLVFRFAPLSQSNDQRQRAKAIQKRHHIIRSIAFLNLLQTYNVFGDLCRMLWHRQRLLWH